MLYLHAEMVLAPYSQGSKCSTVSRSKWEWGRGDVRQQSASLKVEHGKFGTVYEAAEAKAQFKFLSGALGVLNWG